MPQTKSAIYAGVIVNDTASTPGANVTRQNDSSINIGELYTTGITNTGGEQHGITVASGVGSISTASNSFTRFYQFTGATSFAFGLPPANASSGIPFRFSNLASVTINLTANGLDYIVKSGVASAATMPFTTVGQQMEFYSDGTRWLAGLFG